MFPLPVRVTSVEPRQFVNELLRLGEIDLIDLIFDVSTTLTIDRVHVRHFSEPQLSDLPFGDTMNCITIPLAQLQDF